MINWDDFVIEKVINEETKSKYLNTFQGVPPLVNPFQKITFNATSAISHNSFTLDRRQSLGIQAIANGSVLINTDPFQINPIPISTTIQYDRLIAQMST